jgi:broad specificity phosphatase PhoE
MTKFYLIRHATNDYVGKRIAGRSAGVLLNAEGLQQADILAQHLCSEPIEKIFCSPLERCQQTAAPLAKKLNVPVQISDALAEVEFGDWTGKSLKELASIPEWHVWDHSRTRARIPNGETIEEVQSRMVNEVEKLRSQFPNATIGIVSHGDPIRAVLFHYLSISLDLMLRLEIDPASVSMIEVSSSQSSVRYINKSF